MPTACPEQSQRGGKRPGAGAPKGNMNAVKSGRYSMRLRAVAKAMSSVPEIRDMLIEAQRRQLRDQRKAELLAYRALLDLVSKVPAVNNPLLHYVYQPLDNGENRQN